jgi:hypothetical protein
MSPRYFRPPHGGPGGPPPHLRGGPPPWGRGFRPPFDPNFSPRGMPRRPPMGGPPRGRGYHPPRGRLPGPPRGPPGVMRPRPPFGPRFPHSAPHSPMSTHRPHFHVLRNLLDGLRRIFIVRVALLMPPKGDPKLVPPEGLPRGYRRLQRMKRKKSPHRPGKFSTLATRFIEKFDKKI